MKLHFVLQILSLILFTSSSSSQTNMDLTKQLRYLALGDSYTIGEAVETSERFPAQLVAALRKRDISIADPLIIAHTGWTTDELNAAINSAVPEGVFDLVTLLIGVNNQYRKRSAEEYRGEFKALLQRAIGFAGGKSSRVIVVSIPDWGVTLFAEGRDRKQIAKEIDEYNAFNWEESVRAHAQYVDITPISRENERYSELVATDGLHPSGLQYKYWVEIIVPKALNALGIESHKENK